MTTGDDKMETMPEGFSHRIPVRGLKAGGDNAFDLRPDAAAREALRALLGLRGLRKLRLHGRIVPLGRSDWRLEAQLGATCVQDCVVSGRPVTTRIDRPVVREFRTDAPPVPPPGSETEFDGDDITEPLGDWIDIGAILGEELSLALPDYPRAPDAALPPEAGNDPMHAADAGETARPSPFAVLAALREGGESAEDGSDAGEGDGNDGPQAGGNRAGGGGR